MRRTPLPGLVLASAAAALLCVPLGSEASVEFQACVNGLQDHALEAGIPPGTVNAGLSGLQQQTRVLELDKAQPEFFQTFWTYLDTRVNAQRISRGRELLAEHRPLLERIHAEFGVMPKYLVALWGLETNYGGYFGRLPVMDSLATLACDPRRGGYFTRELIEALRILDAGHATRASMRGSWAGAMGHTQFMPSTFNAHALDYDGSGRIDLWNSLPDALGSAANYLQALGWDQETRWGREVRLPKDFAWDLAGLKSPRSLQDWAERGVLRADGGPLPVTDMDAALLLPAGHRGPAFLVYGNFHRIMRWNASSSYALAVGHLADRIAGGGGLEATPTDQERPLRREEIVEIQTALSQLGHDSGTADGMVGPMTRQAIRGYQLASKLPADGYPDVFLLEHLRKGL